MTFWEKIKQTLRSFMNGRNGVDQLGMALLWGGLIAYLLGSILTGVQGAALVALFGMLLSLAGFAAYIVCIWRMFSRNVEKRRAENRRYMLYTERQHTKLRQAKVRFQNARSTSSSSVRAAAHGCACRAARELSRSHAAAATTALPKKPDFCYGSRPFGRFFFAFCNKYEAFSSHI